MAPSTWVASSYLTAGPVNLCWSDATNSGSWAYTGLKWDAVAPCTASCTCCTGAAAGANASQCLPDATHTCCAAAALPAGQYCCDQTLGTAGLALGPTGFSAPAVVPFQSLFTIQFQGCGLSIADLYSFIPSDDDTPCSGDMSSPLPNGASAVAVETLTYNGVSVNSGIYDVCYGFQGTWFKLPGVLRVAGPAAFTTTPSPPIASQPFTVTVQGVNLSSSDQVALAAGAVACSMATSPVGVATLSHGDVDTAIFGSITLGAGTFTMCYTHNAVAVQLSSAFTIYPAPQIVGVYSPTLQNASGELRVGTCMVVSAGYHALVAGQLRFDGSAGSLWLDVTFSDTVPAGIAQSPAYSTAAPAYGCAVQAAPAALLGACFSLLATATDASGYSVNSTANSSIQFCLQSTPAPTLTAFQLGAAFLRLDVPTPTATALVRVHSPGPAAYASGLCMLEGPGGQSKVFSLQPGTKQGSDFSISQSLVFSGAEASGMYNLTLVTLQDANGNFMTYLRNALYAVGGGGIDLTLCRLGDALCTPFLCPGCTNGDCVLGDNNAAQCSCFPNFQPSNCTSCVPLFTGSDCRTLTNNTLLTIPDGSNIDFYTITAVPQQLIFVTSGAGGTTLNTDIGVEFLETLIVATSLVFSGSQFLLTGDTTINQTIELLLRDATTLVDFQNVTLADGVGVHGAGTLSLTGTGALTGPVVLTVPLSAQGAALQLQTATLHVAGLSHLESVEVNLLNSSEVIVYQPLSASGLTSAIASLGPGFWHFLAPNSSVTGAHIQPPCYVGQRAGSAVNASLLPAGSPAPLLTVAASSFWSLAVDGGVLAVGCGDLNTSTTSLSLSADSALQIHNLGAGPVRTTAQRTRTYSSPALTLQGSAAQFANTAATFIPNSPGGPLLSPIATPALAFSALTVQVKTNHTHITDLDIVLIAPDGTRVELFRRSSQAGANMYANFTDSAGQSAATAPISAFSTYSAFQPLQSLSNIKSPQPKGIWQLSVQDTGVSFVGFLQLWQLFATAAPSTATLNGRLHLVPAAGYTPAVGDELLLLRGANLVGNFTDVTHEFGVGFRAVMRYQSGQTRVTLQSTAAPSPSSSPSPSPFDTTPSPAEELALAVGISLVSLVALAGAVVLVLWSSRLMSHGLDTLPKWAVPPSGAGDGATFLAVGHPVGGEDEEDGELPEELALPVPAVPPSLAALRQGGRTASPDAEEAEAQAPLLGGLGSGAPARERSSSRHRSAAPRSRTPGSGAAPAP
eukprot:EG_transcript_752